MADSLKVLGQVIPSAGVLTPLYTPAGSSAVVSSVLACNRGSAAARFRLAVAVAAAADDPKQYLYYDQILAPFTTFAVTLGIALATTDAIRVQSDTGTVAFNAFGVEVT